jgi:hypothetical protein
VGLGLRRQGATVFGRVAGGLSDGKPETGAGIRTPDRDGYSPRHRTTVNVLRRRRSAEGQTGSRLPGRNSFRFAAFRQPGDVWFGLAGQLDVEARKEILDGPLQPDAAGGARANCESAKQDSGGQQSGRTHRGAAKTGAA